MPDYFWLIGIAMALGALIAVGAFDFGRRKTQSAINKIDNDFVRMGVTAFNELVWSNLEDNAESLRRRVDAARQPESDGGTVITEAEVQEIAKSILSTVLGSLAENWRAAVASMFDSPEAMQVELQKKTAALTRAKIRDMQIDIGEASDPLALSGQPKPAAAPGS